MTVSGPTYPNRMVDGGWDSGRPASKRLLPKRAFIAMLGIIFITEILIMLAFGGSLGNSYFILHAAVDGLLITLVAFALAYYSLYRPMVKALDRQNIVEEELRLERDKLDKILNSMDDGVYIVNRNYDIEYVNPYIEKQFGPWAGRKCHEYFHDRSDACPWCKNEEVFAGKSLKWEFHLKKNNRIFELFDTPITNTDGSVSKLEIIHDISDRVNAEQERARLAVAIEQAAEAVVMTNQDGVIVYVNPAFEIITGYSAAEAVGKTPSILKSGLHESSFYNQMWENIKAGAVWKGVFINRKKSGELCHVETTISPVRAQDGAITHYVGIKRDITTEIEKEKRAMQSQKLQAIGTLAGGIAHDFNNILTAIIGHAEMASLDSAPGSDTMRGLEQILKASARARDMVKRILAFSRGSPMELKPVSLSAVVEDTVKLLRSTIPSTIEIRQNIAPNRLMAMGDPTQIGQIVMNLFSNAEHAMRDTGGILEISLDRFVADKASATALNLKPGQYALLTISDTGYGMTKEVLEKIFEPFFTTKKLDEGVGLGLSVAHGIITGMGGAISVNSHPGEGAVFKVFIPLMKVESVLSAEAESTASPGSGQILFVDDEQALVDMWRKVLARLGYNVICATRPNDALSVFKSNRERFDLVITDQTMPEMTGLELAREIMNARKGTPVILLTGFSASVSPEQAKAAGVAEFAMKPVTMAEMSRMIRSALNGGRTESGKPSSAGPPAAAYP